MGTEAPIWLVWLVAFAQGLVFGMWLGVKIILEMRERARARA